MKNIFILTHENIALNNRLPKILFRIILILYQCAINYVMVSSKNSGI